MGKKKSVLIVVALLMVVLLVGCSNSKKIVGTWQVSYDSQDEVNSDYPEENFVIYENGTFTTDGYSGTYSIDDNMLTLSFGVLASYTYEYDISGNTLMLRNIEEENSPEIYYDKVD